MRASRPARLFWTLTMAATLVVRPGLAQNASKEAAAQALFDEGVKLMGQGSYAEACPKFASSEQLDPGAGTLLNLASCYEKTGQTASAWATYSEAEAAADKTGRTDWSARAHERAASLVSRLPRLSVDVPPDAASGLTLARDGVGIDPGAYGVAIPVDPGDHTIVARAPGKRQWSKTVRVENEGQLVRVSIPQLEDEQVAPIPQPTPETRVPPALQPPPPSSSWSTTRWVGVALGGAGVIGLTVGAVLGLVAKSKYDDAVARDCPGGGTQCNAEGVSLGHDAHGLANGSTAAFVVGGLAVGAGIVLFVTAPATNDGVPIPSAARLELVPRVGPGAAGVAARGWW